MSTVRTIARQPAASRIATALIGGLAGLGFLLGCSEAGTETDSEPARGAFSFDADRIERELLQFQNRRAAWAQQYAKSSKERNVNLREHLAHKDAAPR